MYMKDFRMTKYLPHEVTSMMPTSELVVKVLPKIAHKFGISQTRATYHLKEGNLLYQTLYVDFYGSYILLLNSG